MSAVINMLSLVLWLDNGPLSIDSSSSQESIALSTTVDKGPIAYL